MCEPSGTIELRELVFDLAHALEAASVLVSDGSSSTLERALLVLRAALWDHATFGRDAIGLRRVA